MITKCPLCAPLPERIKQGVFVLGSFMQQGQDIAAFCLRDEDFYFQNVDCIRLSRLRELFKGLLAMACGRSVNRFEDEMGTTRLTVFSMNQVPRAKICCQMSARHTILGQRAP